MNTDKKGTPMYGHFTTKVGDFHLAAAYIQHKAGTTLVGTYCISDESPLFIEHHDVTGLTRNEKAEVLGTLLDNVLVRHIQNVFPELNPAERPWT